jgi:hypothetical protein
MDRNTSTKTDVFTKMAEAWPAPGFTRGEVGRVTGGLISGKTLANLASLGEGPPMLKLRGRAYYEVRPFIQWLRQWTGAPRRIPHGADRREPCPDCGCEPGEKHKPFCDQEQCPVCGGQKVSCECNGEGGAY